eukprot:SAG31_NODE_33559_length_342_cov_1.057613_1_plen_30_part_01
MFIFGDQNVQPSAEPTFPSARPSVPMTFPT